MAGLSRCESDQPLGLVIVRRTGEASKNFDGLKTSPSEYGAEFHRRIYPIGEIQLPARGVLDQNTAVLHPLPSAAKPMFHEEERAIRCNLPSARYKCPCKNLLTHHLHDKASTGLE